MARSLTGHKITLKLAGSLVNTLEDASSVTVSQPNANIVRTITNGVEASQANRAWQSVGRTIASGAQEIIDLNDFEGIDIGTGNGNDAVGIAMDLEEVVMIVIANTNAVTAAGQLEVLPSNSQGWTPIGTHTVANGGALKGQGLLMKMNMSADAFDIGPTTSHRITLRAVGGAVTYSMYVTGRHDDDTSSQSSSSSSISTSSQSSSQSSSSPSSSSLSSSSISTSSQSSSSISTSSESSSLSSSISTSSSSQSSSSSSQSSSSQSSESSSSLS